MTHFLLIHTTSNVFTTLCSLPCLLLISLYSIFPSICSLSRMMFFVCFMDRQRSQIQNIVQFVFLIVGASIMGCQSKVSLENRYTKKIINTFLCRSNFQHVTYFRRLGSLLWSYNKRRYVVRTHRLCIDIIIWYCTKLQVYCNHIINLHQIAKTGWDCQLFWIKLLWKRNRLNFSKP